MDPTPFRLEPDIEAQEIRSPLTDVSWHVADSPKAGATTAFVLVAGSGTLTMSEEEPVAIAGPWVVWLPPGPMVEVRLTAGARGARLRIAGGVLARVLPLTGARHDA